MCVACRRFFLIGGILAIPYMLVIDEIILPLAADDVKKLVRGTESRRE
jgi:hypothetical protein